jgi:hypothetical protein
VADAAILSKEDEEHLRIDFVVKQALRFLQ